MDKRLGLALLAAALLAVALLFLLPDDDDGAGDLREADRAGDAAGRALGVASEGPTAGLKGAGRGAPPGETAVQAPSPIDLASVDRDRDLHGVVVHQDGTPVAGASVRVITYPWRYSSVLVMDGQRIENPGPSTTSATDGSFAIRLALGDQVHLRVSADALATTEFAMLQAGEFLRAVLHEPVRLIVKAKAPDGTPAANLQLRAYFGSRGGGEVQSDGATDASGVCVFEGLPPGQSGLLMSGPRVYAQGHPGWIEITLPKMGAMTHDLLLAEGRLLTGRITDAESAEPIADARIGMGHFMTPETRSDEDGQYALPSWTGRGVDDIDVLAAGYARAQAVVGDKKVLDFALRRGFSVKGRLLGRDGKPVEGALVNSVGSRHEGFEQLISMAGAVSAEDGTFALEDLRRDLPHNLTIHAHGYARWMQSLSLPSEASAIDLGDLELQASRTLVGRVVDTSGEPLARIFLDLSHLDPAHPFSHYGRSWDRFSDDLGRFRYVDLPPGRYSLMARPAGRPRATKEVTIKDTDAPTEMTLTMDMGREVRVHVVDEDGNPVPGCYVAAYAKDRGSTVQAKVKGDGLVVLRLPPKIMELRVWFKGDFDFVAPEPTDIGAEETEARIVLQRAALTTGQVLAPDGTPVPWAQIEVRHGEERLATVYAVEAGRFEYRAARGTVFDLVFAGYAGTSAKDRYRFEALPMRGVVENVRAGATDVRIRSTALASDRSLTVRVLDPAGRPVAKVGINLDPAPTTRAPRFTGSDGTLEIKGLRDIETKVSLSFGSTREQPWCSPPARTLVPTGQTIEMRLVAGTTIEGTLLDERGKPMAIGGVYLHIADKLVSWAKVDGEGRFVAVVHPDETRPVKLQAYKHVAGGQALRASAENVLPGATNVVLRFERLK